MKRIVLSLLTLPLLAPVFALDKPAMELHIRKALNLDSRTAIRIVDDPKPAPFGNLNMITVSVGGGNVPVYISKDEKKYFWGYVFDNTSDPDKDRADQIKLDKAHIDGSPNAPITIVEYSDLECQYCQKAHEILKNDLRKFYRPDQVRVVFKHFPLGRHAWAETAAEAAECAAEEKEAAFFPMIDLYFKNAEKLNPGNIEDKTRSFAKDQGLNMNKFDACRKSDRMLAKIRADKQEGGVVGVQSTPTLFINGRMRRGIGSFEDIKVVIEEKLQEAAKK